MQMWSQPESINQQLSPDRVILHSIITSVELKRLINGKKVINDNFLMNHSEHSAGVAIITLIIITKGSDTPRSQPDHPGDHIDDGTFPCPIGAEQTKNFPAVNGEINPFYCRDTIKRLM